MGRPPAIKEGEIEELLQERDKVALTTGEIAEEFGCHRKTAHERLKNLEHAGDLHCDKMSQADAWYLADNDPIVTVSDGGFGFGLKDRVAIVAVGSVLTIGAFGVFGALAILAGNSLPFAPLWFAAWAIGLGAAVGVITLAAWKGIERAKESAARYEKYPSQAPPWYRLATRIKR